MQDTIPGGFSGDAPELQAVVHCAPGTLIAVPAYVQVQRIVRHLDAQPDGGVQLPSLGILRPRC